MIDTIINSVYLIAAVLFIFAIKGLTHVKTARRGNFLSALAMFLAIVATVVKMQIDGMIGWGFIIAGFVIGGAIGAIVSQKVKMTAMPQMVAIFNGMGGGASVAVAASYFLRTSSLGVVLGVSDSITTIIGVIIGAVTLTGSLIAFSKLQGIIKGKPLLFPGNNILNIVLFLVVLVLSVLIVLGIGDSLLLFFVLVGVALLLGILLVTPIGGADMPVVISLLNSYSGLAAAAAGFILKNSVLVISGALVGASGIILTRIMCKAMNRSLTNVLFGGFGQKEEGKKDTSEYENVKSCEADEAAIILDNADSVIFVPGYGLAVAQAQHAVKELADLLQKKGKKVAYAIHPVAGRMPGHMNVLLAEANVPYEQLHDLDSINPEFKNTDVVIVIGANDVVNPAASKEKSSPIYGMPILNTHEAKTVIIIKRSLSPGFAGIKNKLFEYDNSLMFFEDGKAAVKKIVQEFKEL